MQQSSRRVFMLKVVTGASVLAGTSVAVAADGEKLTEDDPYAKSMGFKFDTNKVDKAKYPRHDVSQTCAKCQLYDGKEGDAWGPCSFFGGRLVQPTGWCRNFKVRKAAA
jgi:hypothetical protein